MMRSGAIATSMLVIVLSMVRSAVAQTIEWPELTVHAAEPFDADAVRSDDQQRAEAGELQLYARTLRLQANSWNDGFWTTDGMDKVCRIAVASAGAQAIELLLEDVHVPQGATLRMFATDGTQLSEVMALALREGVVHSTSPMVLADLAVLEYRQPGNAPFEGRFAINGLAHAYRFVANDLREGPCHVNVACDPESVGWEEAIDATVRISVVTPQGSGWCTGTLVNNVRQDCTPYILTAFHCGRTSTTAHFNQYKFYFNFQYATCAGGGYSTAQFITGAQRVAYSDDYAPEYQGLGGSDFLLLRANVEIPETYGAFWAGWDATAIANVSADGVCVHHPTGAPKRISTYTQTLTTGHPMTSSGLMSHYKLRWAPTQNGFGITEVGSSGAAVFKPNVTSGPLLIGTLTGSSSGMSCSNNTGTSYFGKMSYHWTNNPNTITQKLKYWLDPDDSGTLLLGGSSQPCGTWAGTGPEVVDEALVCWPNPATTTVTIELDRAQLGRTEGSITSMTGQVVKRWSSNARRTTLGIEDLHPGFYLLTVFPSEGIRPIRSNVVIER